jgi:uncharacterized protein (TIGR02145 family)
MKKTLVLCLSLLFTLTIYAQEPSKYFYSTTVKNGTDNVLKNQVVSIKLSILKDTYSGDPVYVETQQTKTNEDGYVHLVIGQGAIELGNYSSVDLSKGAYWLQTEIAPTGTNYLTPVVQEMDENEYEYGHIDLNSGNFFKILTRDLFNSWSVRILLILSLGGFLFVKFELWNLFSSKPKRSYRFVNSETKTNTNSQIGTNNGFPQLNTNSHLATNKEDLSYLGDLKEKNSGISQSNTNSQIDINKEDQSHLVNHYGKYLEVTIGEQVWMSENLNVDKFRNGDSIPQAKSEEEWKKAGESRQPAYCYYENDPANGAKYGKLYNWYAVMDPRGLAPKGWHVPSDAEWRLLTDYLGGVEVAGAKIKSTRGWYEYKDIACSNCASWNQEYREKVPCHTCRDTRVGGKKKVYRGNGSNISGFSGLPGGTRQDGLFYSDGQSCDWWSSTDGITRNLWGPLNSIMDFPKRDKGDGCSVRCLRD